MTKKEMDRYISQLKKGDITRRRIPEEVKLDDRFIIAERKAKTRFWDRRGYNVINNNFFVIEKVLIDINEDKYTKVVHDFETFEEFYTFLEGDIYNNSSYYQFNISEELVGAYNLDVSKLGNTHFIDYTIDCFKIEEYFREKIAQEEQSYNDAEKTKKNILKWVDRLCECKTLETFAEVYKKFSKSKYKDHKRIVNTLVIKKEPDIIFDYLINEYNHSGFYEILDIEALFGFYDINKIADAVIFEKRNFSFSANTFSKRKREFKAIVDRLSSIGKDDIDYDIGLGHRATKVIARFSPETHFYTVAKRISYGKNDGWIHVFNVFLTFDEFVKFLNNDLSGCDLSGARLLDVDFSQYMIDEGTELPKKLFSPDTITSSAFDYQISKKYENGIFKVNETWEGLGEIQELHEVNYHGFSYFGDFVYYLNGNLTNADFSLCNNLVNLQSIDGLDLSEAVLQSNFCDKFNIPYIKVDIPSMQSYSFLEVAQNEESTALILSNKQELGLSMDEISDYIEIAYISDIHLMHMFKNRGCKTAIDCDYIINAVAKRISSVTGYLLIGGDIASDFTVFEHFIKALSEAVPYYSASHIVFVLGNHELWGCEGIPLAEIINKYRLVIGKYGFRLLQNQVLYTSITSGTNVIDEAVLLEMSVEELRVALQDARLVIFGGIGFSGLNNDFNANNGIYRTIISHEQEVIESARFEKLYNKVCDASDGRNLVVLSHMPKADWTLGDYKKDVIYVSGHTHKNYFFDEDGIRIYADNQLGYKSPEPFLKKFYINKEFDCFYDYHDGIYEITIDQYRDFHRAKNIQMECNRKGQYFMLKKNEYYCFFFYGLDTFTRRTGLFLLNGGQIEYMSCESNVEYYYNNMDEVISIIRKPLDRFTAIQQTIADQIKVIGGNGFIHGAIVDIDFNNHIYVNPYDLTITAYWGADIVYKKVYKNIPSLLKAECPTLYGNYIKCIEDKKENALVTRNDVEIDLKPKSYYDTKIYNVSREIKKMQRVNKGILTTWPDNLHTSNLIEK